jgi:SAM-dependent methyltransferase
MTKRDHAARDGIDLTTVAAHRDMLTTQYASASNLRSRVSVYQYLHPERKLESTFGAWVLDHASWRGSETVADVGCGPGQYLLELSCRAQRVIAIDLSVGMLQETGQTARGPADVVTLVANAQELPLGGASLDVLLAAHMLYHVQDVELTLAEFRRVVKRGGILLVALNGANDKSEIRSVWEEAGTAVLGYRFRAPHWGTRANLDDTPDQIAGHFASVAVDRLPGLFRFPSADPPMTWIESLRDGTEGVLSEAEWEAVVTETRARIERLIHRDGEFCATKDSGVVIAK